MRDPFRAVPILFLSPPDSELLSLLQEADRLVEREPRLLELIEEDLDRHGKAKKAIRLQDDEWRQARSEGLPTLALERAPVEPDKLRLGIGRPRTSAYVVYMFLVGRGLYGGFKSSGAMTLLQESTTLAVFLANHGRSMPGLSTLNELVNAVSNETREQMLDAQLRAVLDEGWDDFTKLTQDSTAVEGNTQWPRDSHLMVCLVARLLHRGAKLERLGLPRIDEPRAIRLLSKMRGIDKRISMGAGRPGSERERRKLYAKLLRMARRAFSLLVPHVDFVKQRLAALDVEPSRRKMAERAACWLTTDVVNLLRVIECCRARVVHGNTVPVELKLLSVADEDVGFIAKGGREPTVGYKPQLGRSAAGFIVGFILPQGNASDSGQLVPMFEQVVCRTQTIPVEVSVDDGYASRQGRQQLKDRGVKVVSISGSKGRKITPADDWDDPDYLAARNGRSAVESLMFTIKHGFGFGHVMRRGLENVRAEMLEKILAYNFCRMAKCRSAGAQAPLVAA